MINMFLGLMDNKFTDLLGQSSFWFSLAAIIGVIIIIVICIKNPKIGGPILLSLFGVVLVGLDIFCVLQINSYYTAEGGIHGKLSGIFKTNEIEILDNLKFEVKNIELTEKTEGIYSASILSDKVLSLDTKKSLGVFINGMPCDTTSVVESDYAIANYVYTFYDNDKAEICTDTLTLNFAFYENSTYLSLSTKGGTLPVEDCVEYWHYYFNKNGFIVEIAPFEKVSSDTTYVDGDTSNYSTINYYVNNELWKTDYALTGSTITLKKPSDENFSGWKIGTSSEWIGNMIDYKVVNNVDLYALFNESYELNKTFTYTPEEISQHNTINLNEFLDLNSSLINDSIFYMINIELVQYEEDYPMVTEILSLSEGLEETISLPIELTEDNVLHINSEGTFIPNENTEQFVLTIKSVQFIGR